MGVVLCGGKSQRMGRDKGLLPARLAGSADARVLDDAGVSAGLDGDRPWALLMGDKLSAQGLSVVYSIQERQFDAYSAVIPHDVLIVDTGHGDGPLDGLYSVHHRFPHRDLLLVACDMPDLDAATIRGVMDAYGAAARMRLVDDRSADDRSPEFFAYEEQGMLQPFCAIYTHRGLARTLGPARSLQGLLREGPTYRRPITDLNAFKNYNTL